MRILLAACLALTLAACDRGGDDGVVDVAFIAPGDDLFETGLQLGPAGQAARAAQRQGLVRLNAEGEIVPGIAERWIVTDDGRSYIFRITEFDLPDGTRLTAQTVRQSLVRTIKSLDGTSLGLDLAKIAEVRAMTGRVVEIRLTSPMPGFLQLIAQPELGIAIDKVDSGPMVGVREGKSLLLTAMPPEQRGLSAQPDWGEGLSMVQLTAVDAQAAVSGFSRGHYDAVFGGRVDSLTLAATGPLSRGTVRLDPAIGLFGLDVARPTGFLESAENREAVAMAIDRDAIAGELGIGGWHPTNRIVPADLPQVTNQNAERWSTWDMAQRQATAAARVASWNGGRVTLAIDLPEGPGSTLLFRKLASDLNAVGIEAVRAGKDRPADLTLRDRAARFAGPRWFLNQFNCRVARGVCAAEADDLVTLALQAGSPAEEAAFLAQAEDVLLAKNLYIPLGSPIRWSQLRANVEGFSENIWAVHPLFPLSRAPI